MTCDMSNITFFCMGATICAAAARMKINSGVLYALKDIYLHKLKALCKSQNSLQVGFYLPVKVQVGPNRENEEEEEEGRPVIKHDF